ncbi:MAG: hypothetical protein ACKO1F_18065, partial [Flammeovirgaceae bacterium]
MTRETKRIIIFVFGLAAFICFPISLVAQKSEKQFGIGAGLYYHDFRDASIATKSQSGSSVSLILLYRASGIKNRHHVQLLYAAPSLRSSYLLAKEQTGFLQYAYHRKFLKIKDFTFFGGGVIEFGGSNRKYSEIDNLIANTSPFPDGETLGTISPSVLIEATKGKGKFGLQVWAAFAGYTAHNQSGFKNGKLIGLDNLIKFDARISYSRFFSDRWDGRLDYQMQTLCFDYQVQNYAFTSITSF